MADTAYATRADLATFGLMASATQPVPDATLDAILESASRELDNYFRARYSLPLLGWDTSIREKTCWIAAYMVMTARGYSQDGGYDQGIEERYKMAVAWAEGVERQRIHPHVQETPVQAPAYQFPQVATCRKAGW